MLYSTSVIGLALARPNALLARQLGGWSHTRLMGAGDHLGVETDEKRAPLRRHNS